MTSDTLAHLLAQMQLDGEDKLLRNEGDLQTAIIAYLRSNGWEVTERVKCAAGEADLVAHHGSQSGVIEIKLALSRRALYESASQVLAYRAAINPSAKAIVVGYGRSGTARAVAAVESLGVTVIMLKAEGRVIKKQASASLSSQLSAFGSPPSSLQWNISPFAKSRGITTVTELVAATGLPKQSLYGLWRGEARQISVQTLEKLCVGLGARPGDWFVWEGEGEKRRLAWNVAARAQSLGLTPTKLAFRASVYYRMVQLVWQGTGQSIFIQTLGKLAQALSTEGHPFDLGDLFIWPTDEGRGT